MNSDLEKRIMKRVYYLSIYKSFRSRVPLKVLLLAITLSASTKLISYKVIYNYLSGLSFENMFRYSIHSIANAPVVKLLILALAILLVISVVRDMVVNSIRRSRRIGA